MNRTEKKNGFVMHMCLPSNTHDVQNPRLQKPRLDWIQALPDGPRTQKRRILQQSLIQ